MLKHRENNFEKCRYFMCPQTKVESISQIEINLCAVNACQTWSADKIIRICTNYIRSSCKISNSMKYIVCDSDLVDWIQFTWCLKNKSFSRLNEFMFCLITKMQTIHSHMFVIYLHLVTFRKCHQSGPTQYVYICNGYKFVYMCHI